ncbi:Yip1 domain protein [Roseivivax sp. THAF40]|uniref:YIP1 family protein n=1 Tax=unclassified Roseivivax TaxID=2639302 RepID=UPI001267DB0F|nr:MULTISPECIES: YIP1 family protein [unclassified Roseivivax]QFS82807.1 Yip1 domain protein [Roseivivax sp. THAF197b]QFT46576.1 Yip1 domain protein [Roseivivax sp. THAF40]
MPVTSDIVASYRGPGRVVGRLLSDGRREERALAILMAACLLYFLSRLPSLARDAHLQGEDLNPLLGGALFGWIFIAPLLMYGIAGVSHMLARVLGGKGTWFGARMALFWALLASSPLVLLNGLVAGFIGPGPGLTVVGLLWVVVFLWFWISGLRVAEKGASPA